MNPNVYDKSLGYFKGSVKKNCGRGQGGVMNIAVILVAGVGGVCYWGLGSVNCRS